jgi:hypothetical protein
MKSFFKKLKNKKALYTRGTHETHMQNHLQSTHHDHHIDDLLNEKFAANFSQDSQANPLKQDGGGKKNG